MWPCFAEPARAVSTSPAPAMAPPVLPETQPFRIKVKPLGINACDLVSLGFCVALIPRSLAHRVFGLDLVFIIARVSPVNRPGIDFFQFHLFYRFKSESHWRVTLIARTYRVDKLLFVNTSYSPSYSV